MSAVPLDLDFPGHRGATVVAWAAGLVVLAAVMFNAGLAIVNGHVGALGPAAVVACELAVVLAAHAIALMHLRAGMLRWYALLVPILAFGLLRWLALSEPEPRYVRDLALIPTFVVLGMTFPRAALGTFLVTLHVCVLAVLLLEWLSLDLYSALFAIKDYYISTRGASAESFWNTSSSLFVSATRPDDRFFSFVDWHRMSSVFLEPVSLGNYCIFVAACVLSFPRLMQRWQIAVLGLGTALMLVACDGRLATVTILLIALASLLARRLPPLTTLGLPVLTLAIATTLVIAFGLRGGSDTFPGRIAHTVGLLGQLSLAEFMGMSDLYLSVAVDSGIAYLVITQSVVMTGLLWVAFSLWTDERDASALTYKTALAIYISLSMLVSFSFLSIKTAAPFWFVLGALQPWRATELTLPTRQPALRTAC